MAGLALPASTVRAESDGRLLDDPRTLGLAPALATAWLLEPGASAPPAAWPLPRQAWLDAPVTPTLAWLRRARPWRPAADSLEPAGLLSLSTGDWQAALDPRLEAADWRLGGDADASLAESGNGLDAEALWAGRAAFWLHFRDCGLTGDLEARGHPLWRDDDAWIWQETQDGTLTHDETRAGATLWGRVGHASVWQLGLLNSHLRWGATPGRSAFLNGDQAPAIPHLQLRLESGALAFQQTVGQLQSALVDDYSHSRWREKWLVTHRLDWTGRNLALGLGEAVVIADRRPGPGYLLPTGLWWSEQHAEYDQDNTLLTADLRWRLPAVLPGMWMLSGELAVDDYSLSDWGKELEGQRTASVLALDGSPLPVWRREDGSVGGMRLGALRLPGLSWLGLQHTRARPFFGSHRTGVGTWSQATVSLGPFEAPNTRATEARLRHEWSAPRPLALAGLRVDPLLLLQVVAFNQVHGANADGRNVGGDLVRSHEEYQDSLAPFLAGAQEMRRGVELGLDAGLLLTTRSGRPLGTLQLRLDWTRWRRERQRAAELTESLRAWRLSWTRPF